MSSNLIAYLVNKKKMPQKDIAEQLGVSRAQVSRWKAGEMIPLERREALRKLAGLFTDDVEWAAIVETPENGKAWARYLQRWDALHVMTDDDEAEWRTESILRSLTEAGIRVPPAPPLIRNDNNETNPLDGLFRYLMQACGVYLTWISNFMDYNNAVAKDIQCQLEQHTTYLALRLVPDEILIANGSDPKDISHYCQAQIEAARKLIQHFCAVLNEEGRDIMQDYFLLLDADTSTLASMCMNPKSEIESYLTYAERTTLAQMRATHSLLTELRTKIDQIISDRY